MLRGGRSSEHDVSLAGGASVIEGLRDGGHDPVDVLLERDGAWLVDGEPLCLTPGEGLLGCDVVFPVLHGPFGEDGTVQGLLELLDVPYVGSSVGPSAACMDKVVFKDLMGRRSLPQVAYALVQRGDDMLPDVGFPCWVKPARLGSSVGIERIGSAEELRPALERAFQHDSRVIVEAHGSGLEVEVSLLGHTDSPQVSEPGEIVLLKGDGWYDYEAKYAHDGMRLEVPARISAAARQRVSELASQAFTAAGCSGLARVDFFVDGESVLLNEINTLPGFTSTSVYGRLWAASGLAYRDLITRLCEIGVERFEADRSLRY